MSNVCLGKVMEYQNLKYEFWDLDMTRSAKTNRSGEPVGWPCQPPALVVEVVGAIFNPGCESGPEICHQPPTNPPSAPPRHKTN